MSIPSTWEAEAGGSFWGQSGLPWELIQGRPELHSEATYQNKNKKQTNKEKNLISPTALCEQAKISIPFYNWGNSKKFKKLVQQFTGNKKWGQNFLKQTEVNPKLLLLTIAYSFWILEFKCKLKSVYFPFLIEME